MKFVVICFTLLLLQASANEGIHNLSLVVMAPFPDNITTGWSAGPALIPAARIAAEEINNSTEILPNFNLQLIESDSGCGATTKVGISFLKDIYENKDHQVVGIIGPGCSGAALRVSGITSKPQVSLIHVTPSATSPELEDEHRNTTYATISSALSYVESFLALMELNGWNRIATMQDIERLYFKQTHSKFLDFVKDSPNFTLADTLSIITGERSIIPLESLKTAKARVVMVFAGSDAARKLLCYAYHRNMTYPNYQWIFHDRTYGQLVTDVASFRVNDEVDKVTCSRENMTTATNGVILNQFQLEPENKDVFLPLFQKTYNKYYNEDYMEELKEYKKDRKLAEDISPNVYGNSYHDAVWSMALALHNASLVGVDLKSYHHNKNNDTMIIANALSTVRFDGISGPISFRSETRSVASVINILRLAENESEAISLGTFDRTRERKLIVKSEEGFINDTYQVTYIRIHTALGSFVILLTLVFLVFVFAFQIINIIWYHQSSIKATSPNLTHLIFSGCYLFSIFVILYSVIEMSDRVSTERNSTVIFSVACNTMVWCLLLGYSLIFGTVCAKAWRVYRLFKHFRNKSPTGLLSDNALVMLVILLLLLDSIICISWNVLDPLTIRAVESSNTADGGAYEFQCTCRFWNYWIGSIVAYKGILIISLMVISILNRRIKRKNFQHTRNTNLLIYSVTMMGGVGIPLYFLLRNGSIYSGYMIFSIILLSTVVICCLTLFLPPVLLIVRRNQRNSSVSELRKFSLISLILE